MVFVLWFEISYYAKYVLFTITRAAGERRKILSKSYHHKEQTIFSHSGCECAAIAQ